MDHVLGFVHADLYTNTVHSGLVAMATKNLSYIKFQHKKIVLYMDGFE